LEETSISDAAGEREFIQMVNRYEKLVFSVCFRMTQNYFDAEDLTQETFLSLYEALPRFDGENPGGFLVKIATNKCLDYLKRAERRAFPAEDGVFASQEAKNAEPEKLVMEKEIQRILEKACRSLKPPYGEVALDYYCRGQTAVQIAEQSGKKTKTVQTQIRRAKAMLQKKFKKEAVL